MDHHSLIISSRRRDARVTESEIFSNSRQPSDRLQCHLGGNNCTGDTKVSYNACHLAIHPRRPMTYNKHVV